MNVAEEFNQIKCTYLLDSIFFQVLYAMILMVETKKYYDFIDMQLFLYGLFYL